MPPRLARRPLNERQRALVAKYLPLTHKIAVRLARRLPGNVDVDDLASSGTVGLMQAAQAFDPRKSEKFEAFAEFRIRGAMLDDLRVGDTLSRDTRRLSNEMRDATAKLEATLGRTPAQDEIAARLGIAVDELYARQQKLSGWSVVGVDDAGPALLDRRPDEAAADPLDAVMRMEAAAFIEQAVATLPDRTRAIMALYYREHWNMKEIAASFDLTESRICQILHRAHGKIRAALEKAGIEEI